MPSFSYTPIHFVSKMYLTVQSVRMMVQTSDINYMPTTDKVEDTFLCNPQIISNIIEKSFLQNIVICWRHESKMFKYQMHFEVFNYHQDVVFFFVVDHIFDFSYVHSCDGNGF